MRYTKSRISNFVPYSGKIRVLNVPYVGTIERSEVKN